jgi:hypothetical protein
MSFNGNRLGENPASPIALGLTGKVCAWFRFSYDALGFREFCRLSVSQPRHSFQSVVCGHCPSNTILAISHGKMRRKSITLAIRNL